MKLIQNIGLVALLGAFALFLGVFFLADYTLTDQHIQDIVQEKHQEARRRDCLGHQPVLVKPLENGHDPMESKYLVIFTTIKALGSPATIPLRHIYI